MPTDTTPPRAAADAASSAPQRANARFMLSHPVHIVSLGFGSGLAPFMPGTFGTLFGWLTFVVLNRYLTVPQWWLVIAVGFVAGIAMTGFTAKRMGAAGLGTAGSGTAGIGAAGSGATGQGAADPGAVVWDEIVAIWLVMLFVTPVTFYGQLAAFLLFRFFDMVKPPPIRYFDRHLQGGFGIMFDDLVAAFVTLLVIAFWRSVVG
ncbi:phosphatidylglycerophosphatase A family protein [Burkholderia guangdongensis]|uniref:phosphatidylglycerophosphatase A family protein n=1 Tax=Burkholderia guangdongensis TaxID=1792500 RepID=UPI0015C968E9|nr:phosphatidylglycerophosphatase A [Burkholderia guangdongensis]